jgi:heme oxygenase (biliverdin-IX-beta and delta-forming)
VTRLLGLRELLDQERHGVLATISQRRDGWPFASMTLYALDTGGVPLFLMSELAEHTRNVRVDPRASLLVQDSNALEDPLAGARVTLLGTLAMVDEEAAKTRYLARHPRAAEFAGLGDFHVWVLRVDEARYVNGFGDMGWLGGNKLRAALGE